MSILLPANVTNMVHLAIVIYMVVFCFVYPYNTVEYSVLGHDYCLTMSTCLQSKH